MKAIKMEKYKFKKNAAKKVTIITAFILSLAYISWWFNIAHMGNPVLYLILLVGEIYYLLMTYGYWFTIWGSVAPVSKKTILAPTIDVLIPVCGEPYEVVKDTIEGVLAMRYKEGVVADYTDRVKVYILNDGYLAKRKNWKEVEALKDIYPIHIITRIVPGGAKAGNINNALNKTKGEYIVIFDSDMKPYPDLLEKTLGFFEEDLNLAFVQTPQYYINHADNYVTDGAWSQQELFFGTICVGKNRYNSAFCCGTNVVFRRKALLDVGGFDTTNIAEDFSTSVRIHERKWNTLYYPEVLARGFAPMNLHEYYAQQLRWAKGNIDVFLKHNPLFNKELTRAQRIQYLLSLGFYFTGIFVVLDALIPLIYLATGIVPVTGDATTYMILFIPYITLIIYILSSSAGGRLSYKALQFSVGSFYIHITALLSAVLNRKVKFRITSKNKDTDVNLYYNLVWPHVLYVIVSIAVIVHSYMTTSLTPALVTNSAWILFNISAFSAHIYAAFPLRKYIAVKLKQEGSIFRKLHLKMSLYGVE